MSKRKVEVFTEGCPKCEPTVDLVKSLVCDNCELIIYDVKKGCDTNVCRELATKYGVTRYPSVAINGQLLDCCVNGDGPSEKTLRAAGIGSN
ncbi:MAG: glutaredoxin [Bacteriovoracaceae bacterium]|jgi:hypothetical protein|nr:glutaredoxin [Bacteriovoracaceae bacterium]